MGWGIKNNFAMMAAAFAMAAMAEMSVKVYRAGDDHTSTSVDSTGIERARKKTRRAKNKRRK